MNFEEIITEHNDKLVYIFTEAGDAPGQPISHFISIVDAVNELNAETEKKLGQLFDNAFLDSNAIAAKPKKKSQ